MAIAIGSRPTFKVMTPVRAIAVFGNRQFDLGKGAKIGKGAGRMF
jgi:hypothetical protein